MPGSTQPPVHGSAVFAIASDSPQIMLRQAMTSPMFASHAAEGPGAGDLGRLDAGGPVMKSSLTASRVHPCR